MKLHRSAAAGLAVTLQQLAEGKIKEWTPDQELILDALRRSTRDLAGASEVELEAYIREQSPEALAGIASNVKGIYHEMLFERAEGLDSDGISARLFEATNHPGVDVEFMLDGEVISAVQLKAVQSPASILEHMKRYPGVEVHATSEVANMMDGVTDSGFSNDVLTRQTHKTFAALGGDGGVGNLGETAGVSALVAGAMLARTCLNGGRMDARTLRSVLADVGIGATAAVAVDAVLGVV